MATQAGRAYDRLREITDGLDEDLRKLDIVDDPSTRLILLSLHGRITQLAFVMRHLTIDLMDDEDAALQAIRISNT